MNVLNKFTLAVLKKNRTRTAVTIIGVILSVAMITAVATFISSFQNFMLRSAIARGGDWNIKIPQTNIYVEKKISEDDAVKNHSVGKIIGYSKLEGGKNDYKPYLFVEAFSDELFNTLPVNLIKGRMPQNESELLIPEHVKSNGGVEYNIGDAVTIKAGIRLAPDGAELWQQNGFMTDGGETEQLTDINDSKSFTVVGFFERPRFEGFSAPGYTVITKLDKSALKDGDLIDIYLKLNNHGKTYDYASYLAEHDNIGCCTNDDLLRAYGTSNDNAYNQVFYGLGSILVVLIIIGSVLLINNSFSISVSERTKQFGILSSIGATRKQILKSVLSEGAFIGIIGIPAGIIAGIAGIGVTLFFVDDLFDSVLGQSVKLTLSVSFPAVAAAAALGALTILISAYIPAKRGARRSAIDSIRQVDDVKIKAKKIKTSRLTEKLFGIEGTLALKNFKRNKKRYRSTVVSLFVSIVLFVSASTFGAALQKGTSSVINDMDFDFSYNVSNEKNPNEVYSKLKNAAAVTDSARYVSNYLTLNASKNQLSARYADFLDKNHGMGENGEYQLNTALHFIDDTTYSEYLKKLKLNHDEYYDKNNPKVIAINSFGAQDHETNRYLVMDVFNDELPKTLEADYWQESKNDYIKKSVSIGTFAKEAPKLVGGSIRYSFTMFAPESFAPIILDENAAWNGTILVFKSSDTQKTAASMNAVLTESGYAVSNLLNVSEIQSRERNIILVINVFSYGFIILISLITMANVFNTISTNISLRRRELAMLRSIGITNRGFNKMMNFECAFYGIKGILYGLPVALFISWFIYTRVNQGVDVPFTPPLLSMAISALSVFLIVFVTMIYSVRKIKKENTIDALKNDNL